MSMEPRFLSSEEVLHALRHLAQLNNIDPPMVWPSGECITFDTTIKEFDRIRDTDNSFAACLAFFFFSVPRSREGIEEFLAREREMDRLLAQPQIRTVGDLCSELSGRILATEIEPFRILDRACHSAAIFLTLKRRLTERGVKTRRLTPSSRVRATWELVAEAVRIAPDRLPLQEPATPMVLLGCGKLLGLCVMVLMFAFIAFGNPEGGLGLVFGIGLVMTMTIIGAGMIACVFGGASRFPGITTYRDLCKTLAGEPVTRPLRT